MKDFLLIAVLLSGQACLANMASPITRGTTSGLAFGSRDIDIRGEKIFITLDDNFKKAKFIVEYNIETSADGNQIPLLFHAIDYAGYFNVWVDDQLVKISEIPSKYEDMATSPFRSFSEAFKKVTTIYWEDRHGFVYDTNDLKYFETSLAKGKHKIKVEYIADASVDRSDWVMKYRLIYSLAPAKFWKSFGTLDVFLNRGKSSGIVTTNFESHAFGKLDSVVSWHFDKLPSDFLQIDITPRISSVASTLVNIGPNGLTLGVAIVVILTHLMLVRRFSKLNQIAKYLWAIIAGSLVAPLVILYFNMSCYDIIDSAIGKEASRYHGYIFLIIGLYLVFMPIYFLLMWLTGKRIKKNTLSA